MTHIRSYVLMKKCTLRTERKQRGWTQARLAKILGVTTRTVIRWEQGLAQPHPSHRAQLESLFGRSSEELGLWWGTNENEAGYLSMAASLPLARQTKSKVPVPELLPITPASQLALGSGSSLLGRAELLMQVKERLLGLNCLPFTGLYGLPGVGKTTLMRALATDEQVQLRFCDGILWAPLGPQPHLLDQLARWGMQLGVTARDVENPESRLAWGQALRSAIGNRRMLLIIDDAWTIEDALALQVGNLRCSYLMTTRHPQVARAFAGEGVIAIPQLEEADGLALLSRYVLQQVQQDPGSARALVQAVNGLPLALTLMGKYLAFPSTFTEHPWPLRKALAHLQDTQGYLSLSMTAAPRQDGSSLVKTVPLSLYTTIAMCDQQLSPVAHAILYVLTIFPPRPHSFSEETALVVSQQSMETLDELCRIGLLERWGTKCYSLHQTVVDYVRSSIVFQRHNNDWPVLWFKQL